MDDKDPVVAEVRAARDAIWRECGGDLDKLFQRLRQHEATGGRVLAEIVSRPPAVVRREP